MALEMSAFAVRRCAAELTRAVGVVTAHYDRWLVVVQAECVAHSLRDAGQCVIDGRAYLRDAFSDRLSGMVHLAIGARHCHRSRRRQRMVGCCGLMHTAAAAATSAAVRRRAGRHGEWRDAERRRQRAERRAREERGAGGTEPRCAARKGRNGKEESLERRSEWSTE